MLPCTITLWVEDSIYEFEGTQTFCPLQSALEREPAQEMSLEERCVWFCINWKETEDHREIALWGTPSSLCLTDFPPSAGLLTTSVQRWGDSFRAMFPGLGLLMAKFSLLLFNWVHWAILYSKVMHVSYSLISAPSQLTNIFAGKSFYFSFFL